MENQVASSSGVRLIITDFDGDKMEYDSCSSDGSDDGRENYRPMAFLSHPLLYDDENALAFYNGDKPVRADGFKYFVDISIDQPFPYDKFMYWVRNGAFRMVRQTVSPKTWKKKDQIVIVFGTERVSELFKLKLDKTFKEKYNEVMQLVWGPQPGEVQCISSFGSGLVGSVQQSAAFRTLNLRNGNIPCASILIIPSIPALDVQSFVVNKDQLRDLTSRTRVWAFKKMLGITTGNVISLKGIVFLHQNMDQFEESYVKSPLVKCLQEFLRDFPHVAMAGGVSEVMSKGTADDNVAATGFLLFGKQDEVKVTVEGLCQEDVSSRERITAKLTKLKVGELTRRCDSEQAISFGIIFGSVEGAPLFDGKYFEDLFPKTRIVGGYQSRQFSSGQLKDKEKNIVMQKATVVMLVSYYSPKNKIHFCSK